MRCFLFSCPFALFWVVWGKEAHWAPHGQGRKSDCPPKAYFYTSRGDRAWCRLTPCNEIRLRRMKSLCDEIHQRWMKCLLHYKLLRAKADSRDACPYENNLHLTIKRRYLSISPFVLCVLTFFSKKRWRKDEFSPKAYLHTSRGRIRP